MSLDTEGSFEGMSRARTQKATEYRQEIKDRLYDKINKMEISIQTLIEGYTYLHYRSIESCSEESSSRASTPDHGCHLLRLSGLCPDLIQ